MLECNYILNSRTNKIVFHLKLAIFTIFLIVRALAKFASCNRGVRQITSQISVKLILEFTAVLNSDEAYQKI